MPVSTFPDVADCELCAPTVLRMSSLVLLLFLHCQPTGALTYDFPAQLSVANHKFVEGDFRSGHCVVTELNARTEVHTALCHWTAVSEGAETSCPSGAIL